MLEQAIEKLMVEVQKLRETVEHQNDLLRRRPPNPTAVFPKPSPSADACLNEYAVAEILGISVNSLRRWRLFRTGPPYVKIGRLVRYSRAEVLKWLDTQRAGDSR